MQMRYRTERTIFFLGKEYRTSELVRNRITGGEIGWKIWLLLRGCYYYCYPFMMSNVALYSVNVSGLGLRLHE